MANQQCKLCENEPAAFLVSELSTGETVYIGVLCLPPFVKTVWEDAGLPELVLDIVEGGQADLQPLEAEGLAGGDGEVSKSGLPAAPPASGLDGEGFYDPELDQTEPAAADVDG